MRPRRDGNLFILGEAVTARSLAAALEAECRVGARVIHTLELTPELAGILSAGDLHLMEEAELQEACAGAKTVIADPLYGPILPRDCRLLRLPHEAFSGRIFRREIPILPTLDLNAFYTKTEMRDTHETL